MCERTCEKVHHSFHRPGFLCSLWSPNFIVTTILKMTHSRYSRTEDVFPLPMKSEKRTAWQVNISSFDFCNKNLHMCLELMHKHTRHFIPNNFRNYCILLTLLSLAPIPKRIIWKHTNASGHFLGQWGEWYFRNNGQLQARSCILFWLVFFCLGFQKVGGSTLKRH